jgi:hypothetical protein
MHNHSNDPKKLNTIHAKPHRPGKPFVLRAIRDIKPGDQIYISYTRCNRCWHDASYKDCTTFSHYSSPDVFDVSDFSLDKCVIVLKIPCLNCVLCHVSSYLDL